MNSVSGLEGKGWTRPEWGRGDSNSVFFLHEAGYKLCQQRRVGKWKHNHTRPDDDGGAHCHRGAMHIMAHLRADLYQDLHETE